MQVLSSLIGILLLIVLAYFLSEQRERINWRTVLGALAIQMGFAAIVLYSAAGRAALSDFSSGVQIVINYSHDGIGFLFGGLVSDKMFELFGGNGFVLALRVLPVVVFFSALVSVLYHLGVMQLIVNTLGRALSRVLGTSRPESISATANIFLGISEAPLTIRPYLATMTRSQLFAVMVGGMASVAGSVLVGYAQMGIPLEYLLAASFMAAPAGLMMAKLLIPETEDAAACVEETPSELQRPANVIDAAAQGAAQGMQVALNIGAMLLAFVGLIALLNGMLSGIGGWFGLPELSLDVVFGYLFLPFAFMAGIWDFESAQQMAVIFGTKTTVNEFVAFSQLAPMIASGVLEPRVEAIIAFALCGFANFGSIAVMLGSVGVMVPSRYHEIATLGMRSLVAATLANLLNATVAGLFISLI
ncbi:NupC/NupG family nucleoside CNT transporter [Photobacterium lutimaris]|uniref:Nucleoside permease n=1 Tax=Photobacterium lutimaris TaxID=388278 RepID=A0A2T3IV47_9GAMM|nr:NupC/NupG family nucleoside CNT transporter [Photobacterium lutimaris]PSU32273.1 NupC/NupG family nucleoside CNT transporter [Photobacterium lutimaris]TDR73147.1 CNT family concentrative nucleoside transporter [Photobacterium lutimaris]